LQSYVSSIRVSIEKSLKGFLGELEGVLNPTTTIPQH